VLYLLRMAEVDFGGSLPVSIVRTMESAYGMPAFLGYGSLAFSRPSRIFAVLNRGVFAMYIIHLPVQQMVAYYLFPLELSAWPAFLLHLSATLSISALIYACVLRPVRWLHPFFGIAPLKPEPSPANKTTGRSA
jgi:peptidoglycan/LPS O-acetylase OafA/YrhL